MEPVSLYSLYATQASDELSNISQSTQTRRAQARSDSTNRGDTVTLSPEGRAMAAQMEAEQAARMSGGGQDTGSQAFADDPHQNPHYTGDDAAQTGGTGGTGSTGGAGGAGGGGSGSNPADQIEKLEARIKQLSQQVQQIMSGSASTETKVTLASPLQQQIATLQQELQQVQAESQGQTK